MNNIESVYNLIKTISTKFGSAMVVKSSPKLRGGKKCPLVGRVEKYTLISNCRFGSYENKVNSSLAKEDKETSFKSEGRKGMKYVEGMYPYILQSEKDCNVYYITINYKLNDKTTFESVYFVDGHLATEEETKEVKEWLYIAPSKENSKQAEAGLQEEEQVKVVTYKLDNVLHIGKTSDLKTVWDALTK